MQHRRRFTIVLVAGILLPTMLVLARAPGAISGAPPPEDGQAVAPLSSQPQVLGFSGDSQSQPPARPQVVLYDQYNNATGNATSSQDFEPEDDPFDTELADDFPVPAGETWSINLIEVDGVYYNGPGPAQAVHIRFYQNAGTLPGALVAERLSQPYAGGGGDFAVNLSTPVLLPPGHYWVSVVSRQDFDPRGQWGWVNRSVTSYNPAAWRNPGGGFPRPCPNWQPRGPFCGIDPSNPDQVFRLSGARILPTPTFTPSRTPTPTSTPTWTPGASIVKVNNPYGTVQAGDRISYTIAYGNVGGVPLTGVIITDTVPANTILDLSSVYPTATVVGNFIRWDRPTLPFGGSGQVGFSVVLPTATQPAPARPGVFNLRMPPSGSASSGAAPEVSCPAGVQVCNIAWIYTQQTNRWAPSNPAFNPSYRVYLPVILKQ
jgi:uncharacterized repeat protein (TIGR01451 family)